MPECLKTILALGGSAWESSPGIKSSPTSVAFAPLPLRPSSVWALAVCALSEQQPALISVTAPPAT